MDGCRNRRSSTASARMTKTMPTRAGMRGSICIALAPPILPVLPDETKQRQAALELAWGPMLGAEAGYHGAQLERMADGKEPDAQLSPLRATIHYLGAQMAGFVRLMRRPAMPKQLVAGT